MQKRRYTEEQIIGIVKQHEAGMKTSGLCREHGISAAKGCGGTSPSVFGPGTLWRTYGTRVDLWDPLTA